MPVKSTDIPSFDEVMGNQPKGNSIPSYNEVMSGQKKSPIQSSNGSTQPVTSTSGGTKKSIQFAEDVPTELQGNIFGKRKENSSPEAQDLRTIQNYQQQNPNYNPRTDPLSPYYNEGLVDKSKPPLLSSPFLGKQSAQKQEDVQKVETKEAIRNTVDKKMRIGLMDPSDPKNKDEKDFYTKEYTTRVNNGDVSFGIDKNTGELGLKKNLGFGEALINSYQKSKQTEQDAANFVNMPIQDKVNFVKKQQQQTPNPEYIGEKADAGGSIGNLLGGSARQMGRGVVGLGTGAALTYAAPETGGASLEGLPAAMAATFTNPNALEESVYNNTIRRFNEIKKQNPQMEDYDAMKEASNPVSTFTDATLGILQNSVLFEEGGNALNKSIAESAKGALKKSIFDRAKETLKESLQSGAKVGGASGAQTAIGEEIDNLTGDKKSQLDILNDVSKSVADNFKVGMGLHLLTSGVGAVSPHIANAIKFGVLKSGVPISDIQTHLKGLENNGTIEQGAADKVTDDLKNYDIALSKIPESIRDDKKIQIADLIDKKNKLVEASKSKDSNFKETYDTQIAAIDDHIKNVLQEPTEEEVADARAKELSQKMKEKPAPEYLVSRHSDTIKDEQGKISGTDSNPLSEGGKKDAETLANDVQSHADQTGVPVTKVVSSDLERAKETAKTVADKTGAAVHHDEDLRTWDIGQFNDVGDKEFKKVQQWFVEHPDEKIYKPDIEVGEGEKPEDKDPLYGKKIGESFNDYANRTIEAHKKYEGEPASTMLIDHSNNMMVMDAYRKNGNTWDEKAAQEYLKSEKPEPATLQNKAPKNETNGEADTQNQPSQQPTEEAQQPNTGVNQNIQGAEEGTQIGGISHKSLTAIADKLGLNDPERGTYLPIDQQDERGRQLLANGADPDRIIQDFKNDGKVSADGISVVKARAAELEKATDDARDKFGRDSNEFKIAQKELQSFNVDAKKLGTAAGNALYSLSDANSGINTTSQTSMEEALKNETGKEELTPKQIKKISDLVAKNKALEAKNAELEKKLTDKIDKAVKNEKSTTEKSPKKDYAKERKDAFQAARNALKKIRGESQSTLVPYARELAAIAPHVAKIVKSLIEEGVDKLSDIVERIHDEFKDDIKGLRKRDIMDVIAGDYNKKTDTKLNPDEEKLADLRNQARLTKKLQDLQNDLPDDYDKNKKEQSEEVKYLLEKIKKVKIDIAEYKNNTDVTTRFVDKTGNNFSPKDVKDIWDYAKKNYLDKGKSYPDMIKGTATDLGLKPSQVVNAIASPKDARPVSIELYANRSRYNQAQNEAKAYVKNANQNGIWKAIKATTQFWFNKAIFGHGTVGMQTHAGGSLFIPSTWKSYFSNFITQFKNSFGGLTDKGLKKYELRMDDLRHSKNFLLAKRAGLANDPSVSYDEYTGLGKYINNKLGKNFTSKLPNVRGMGDRGFNTIKQFRQDYFDHYYNSLSDAEKADPNSAKNIADLANHSTGTTGAIFAPNSKTETAANAILFAPKLQGSKFARLITQPIEAANTFIRWNKASPSEKAAAKIVANRTGQFLATYAGALALNQGILSLSGSKQKINWTDPTQRDFLKFKTDSNTFDLSGGLINAVGFIGGLIKASVEPSKSLPKGQSRGEIMARVLDNFASNTLSPVAGTVKDILTQHDFSGNTMPYSSDKPLYKDAHKLTWGQYISQTQLPIPVSDAFKTISDNMEQQGMTHTQAQNILGGIFHAVVTGFTGAKIGVIPKDKK